LTGAFNSLSNNLFEVRQSQETIGKQKKILLSKDLVKSLPSDLLISSALPLWNK